MQYIVLLYFHVYFIIICFIAYYDLVNRSVLTLFNF